MPDLSMFVACTHAIVDREDNNLSLINLLSQVRVRAPGKATTAIVPEAKAPLRWCAVAVWRSKPQDAGRTFRQRVLVRFPSGKCGPIGPTMDIPPTGSFHRNILRVDGLSVGEEGTYEIVVELSYGEDSPWVEAGSYPVVVTYVA